MIEKRCDDRSRRIPGWFAVGVGIAAGWAFLIGLYLGLRH